MKNWNLLLALIGLTSGFAFSSTARAEHLYFNGSEKQLQKLIDGTKLPVVVLYSNETLEKLYPKYTRDVMNNVVKNYSKDFRVISVRLNGTLDTGNDGDVLKPYMQIYSAVKYSHNNKVRHEYLGSESPDEYGYYGDAAYRLEEAKSVELDFSQDPFVLALRKQRNDLLEKTYVIENALKLDSCLEKYNKINERWYKDRSELQKKHRAANAEVDAAQERIEALETQISSYERTHSNSIAYDEREERKELDYKLRHLRENSDKAYYNLKAHSVFKETFFHPWQLSYSHTIGGIPMSPLDHDCRQMLQSRSENADIDKDAALESDSAASKSLVASSSSNEGKPESKQPGKKAL